MPIRETLNFNANDYRRKVRGYPTEKLKQQEIAAGRKIVSGSFAVGAGLGGAYLTGGLTLLLAGYKARSTYVANKKHEILQGELHRRNVALHDIDGKDMVIAGSIGTMAVLLGVEVGDFTETITNIELMGSGLPDGANKSTGLMVDPGKAVEGMGNQIYQLAEHLTGGNAAAAAVVVSAADSTAYHAGMVQAQILEEHILLQEGHREATLLLALLHLQ
ncbi:hypothetical protein F4776DRAFT_675066 [Hypoxylon sp. NC0597]|nr:hypothetical protein F4776DRAFT_675066 [Hypoxylon sp. NC0597]